MRNLRIDQLENIFWPFFSESIKAVNPYEGRRKQNGQGRIVNGQNAPLGTLPHQVALRMTEYRAIIYCGGTILSKYYVLTAAHCTDG